MAPSKTVVFCVLACALVASAGVNAAGANLTVPGVGATPSSGVCRLFCTSGSHCIVNKCGEAKCVPLCDGIKCKSDKVCRATENKATCVANPCFLVKCGSSAPNCVVENGSPRCKSCPVAIRFQPVCCKLLDGSLATKDINGCGCRVSGTALFEGECPKSCKCSPYELAKPDVCCRLPDGSQLSIPDCECKCRLAVKGTPTPTPITDPVATTAPTTTYATKKPTPRCLCPVTTTGICCLGTDGNFFHTGSSACCKCLGGRPFGTICPVVDPLPPQPPTSRR